MKNLSKKTEKLVGSLHSRHGRKKSRYCVCEGLRTCREFYRLRPDLLEAAFCSDGFEVSQVPFETEIISADEFRELSFTKSPQGVMCLARRPRAAKVQENAPFLVVLDRISDPGNLGTMLRTLHASGLRQACCIKGTVDPYSDKAIRSGTACQFALDIFFHEDLSDMKRKLRESGYQKFYRTEPHGGVSIFDEKRLFDKSAIIFGGEAGGAAELDGSVPVVIPMPGGAESLNVAQALTVTVFEAVRRGVLR